VVEDFTALLMGAISLILPLLVPLLLVVAFLLIWWIYQLAQRLGKAPRP
jgi:hypothetical protein